MDAINAVNSKRALRKEKLVDTAKKLRYRIGVRFPDSGLGKIADEIVAIADEAVDRAAVISRPNWWLRAGLVLLVIIAICIVIARAPTTEEQVSFWWKAIALYDATKVGAAIFGATAIYLITLETRLKRRRAIKAIRELRAMAHIIDMHQLTKAPEHLGDDFQELHIAGKPLTANEMTHYLHYCTEMLAVVSKVGQLYVMDFSDSVSQTAVDHFESLATGLSNKIWQKLMILDRIQAEKRSGQDAETIRT